MHIVLIHGAFTRPWHWHRLVPHLEREGHEVVVPELPCDDPRAGIEDYVAVVESHLDGGEDPLVVGSSLGAVTACVVAARRPVRGLVTVCGIVPEPGRSIVEGSEPITCPEYGQGIDNRPDGTTVFRPDAARAIAFTDSEDDLAEEAARRLRPQAALPFTERCPIDAMPEVPRRGITAREDRLVRPEWLRAAVRGRLGVEPTELPSDHTPMLSQPARLAEVLLAPM